MSRRIAATLSVLLLSAVALGACQRSDTDTAPTSPASSAASSSTTPTTSAPASGPAAPPAATPDLEYERERQAQLARAAADPVTGVIERAEMCLHFAGEEPFDEARRAQIDRAFRDNRCDTVVADGEALKASRPQDAARIDEALQPLR